MILSLVLLIDVMVFFCSAYWRTVFELFVFKNADLENRVRGQSRSLEMSPFDRAHATSYWLSIVKYGSISCRFWHIQCRKMSWPWNPGYGSLKVIGTDTNRSAIYDFLLTFHSYHELRPISWRFRDSDFGRKSKNFPTPLYFASPLKGFPLELGTGAGGKLEWWGYRTVKEVWRYDHPSGYKTPVHFPPSDHGTVCRQPSQPLQLCLLSAEL